MSDNLLVRLERNDGSEVFNLKASRVETEVSNGLVTDSIISAASRQVLGGKLVLELLTYKIDFEIQGMDSSDYPNSANYSDHDFGMKEELMRASQEWGYDTADGFDVLKYDKNPDGTWKTIDGVITQYNPTEDSESRVAGTYDVTLEWTHLDAYVS